MLFLAHNKSRVTIEYLFYKSVFIKAFEQFWEIEQQFWEEVLLGCYSLTLKEKAEYSTFYAHVMLYIKYDDIGRGNAKDEQM